jgi:hypothetical protein
VRATSGAQVYCLFSRPSSPSATPRDAEAQRTACLRVRVWRAVSVRSPDIVVRRTTFQQLPRTPAASRAQLVCAPTTLSESGVSGLSSRREHGSCRALGAVAMAPGKLPNDWLRCDASRKSNQTSGNPTPTPNSGRQFSAPLRLEAKPGGRKCSTPVRSNRALAHVSWSSPRLSCHAPKDPLGLRSAEPGTQHR